MHIGIIILIVLGAVILGAILGRLSTRPKLKRLGVMDLILILEGVALTTYTVVVLVLFSVTGSEPSALTYCVFGVLGIENGVMGWIKTTKQKQADSAAPDPAPELTGQPMTPEDLEKGGGA